jgi:hypothetical protein
MKATTTDELMEALWIPMMQLARQSPMYERHSSGQEWIGTKYIDTVVCDAIYEMATVAKRRLNISEEN